MPLILFGKRLFSDTCAQENARIRILLKREGIPFSQRAKARTAPGAPFLYQITVRRRDYARACGLLEKTGLN